MNTPQPQAPEIHTFTEVVHRACGTPVTWRLSTLDTQGGPYCQLCHLTHLPQSELSSTRSLCVDNR